MKLEVILSLPRTSKLAKRTHLVFILLREELELDGGVSASVAEL